MSRGYRFGQQLEQLLVAYIRGDFARGQRTHPITWESAQRQIGSFGDVDR